MYNEEPPKKPDNQYKVSLKDVLQIVGMIFAAHLVIILLLILTGAIG